MSTADTVGAIIVRVMRQPKLRVDLSVSLTEGIGADELEVMEIVMEAETAFAIELTDADVETIGTGADLAALVDRILSHRVGT